MHDPSELPPAGEASALAGLMQATVAGVVTIDQRGRILHFNHACEALFGYPASEVIGQTFKTLMPESHQHEHSGYLQDFELIGQREAMGTGGELIGRRKDGTTFPMEMSIGEIDHGEKRSFVGVIRDLTARVRLEHGLRDSEAQHRAVIDTAVDGIIIIDALGTVRMYNPACEKMFGFPGGDVIGQNVKMLMPSPHFDAHDAYLQNYSATGIRKFIGVGREVVGRRRSGTTFPMELSVGETAMGGHPLFVGVLRDITRSKEAEEALRRSEADLKDRVGELEDARDHLEKREAEVIALAGQASIARQAADSANRSKSEFLAIVSHEIRTPMNAILGFARMLDEAGLKEPHGDYASMILRAGDALMTILNDILDVSKIEAGHVEVEKVGFSVADKLAELEKLWFAPARQKGLSLRVVIAPDMPAIVVGDPMRVRQVLFNLVNNAIKFTSSGGVTVSAGVAGPTANGIELRFQVSDTGMGISDGKRAVIFDAFTQADSSTSRRHGGTGLGLNICRRLVQMMGGRIGVESEPGRGSTFWFTIPSRESTSLPPPPAMDAAIDADDAVAPLHVLVAEDHQMNQKMLRVMLEAAGHLVDVVENGRLAVAAVAATRYDVVLMDINMPEMDGVEAMRRIRSLDGAGRVVPIIALTANAMKGDREKYLAEGMTDYLSKPIHIKSLVAALERQRGHSRLPTDEGDLVTGAHSLRTG